MNATHSRRGTWPGVALAALLAAATLAAAAPAPPADTASGPVPRARGPGRP
ncbi:hypothetical protein [Streptomyces sp. NPDC088254]|uniref:hypothetical protein n=1 Tax=Streptomyces sp. NPDC088254 TaxID=3365847 RepID=UPI0037F59361